MIQDQTATPLSLGPFPPTDPTRPPDEPGIAPSPVGDPVDVPEPGPDLPPLPEGDPSREPREDPVRPPDPIDDPVPGRSDPLMN